MLDNRIANSTTDGESISPEAEKNNVGIEESSVSTIEDLSLTGKPKASEPNDSQTWSYVHVHYKSVDKMERDCIKFKDAPSRCFVPKYTYIRYTKNGKRIEKTTDERQAISGLVFYQGKPENTQRYLTTHYSNLYLVKDSASSKAAVIPDKQMVPFMQVVQYQPSLVRIMDHPISYYAQGHKLMRILTGILKGHEGYVVRKAGDRKFIMPFGNKSLSISNVHNEQFVEADS